ncbi:MAG: hypothetical protein SAJ72_10335 [Jaaginema sp. PMC 1080.18]|nr:hypothetical protein [Jaaginema sp. PMC 1080.18]
MSEWIPLPFPKCPSCQESWVRSYHDCLFSGEALVELDERQVKCCSCGKQWYLLNSNFNCSCGYTFQALEVEDALSKTQLLRQRLLQKINEMDFFEKSISTKSQSSFQQWISSISYEIGRLLGTTAGVAKNLIENFFEKWSF